MEFTCLDLAKQKMLEGNFDLASEYYRRAKDEGIAECVVNLRYLTKNYLVYPLEYENAENYFELIKQLHKLQSENSEYRDEYVTALNSLLDIRRLFLRSLALFYYSDILVSQEQSVILWEIAKLCNYIRQNKNDIIEKDIYKISEFCRNYNKNKFINDLNIVEVYCLNILLSYTAVQHSVYQGKRYNALTVDYGYFYSTTVKETNRYYNYANIKPRLFLIGCSAYYYDFLNTYKEKTSEIKHFNSPKELQKELSYYVEYKDNKDVSAKEFIRYAKHFEKQNGSKSSLFGTLNKIATVINPMLKLNPVNKYNKNNVGSFELDEYFPQKKIFGVCSMLSCAKGFKVDTVRYLMLVSACIYGLGGIVYIILAIAKKYGFYFGVHIEKP